MKILIGITSSISAYKIYELIRMFIKQGHEVKTVLSRNALEFVLPLVLETLSNNPCYYQEFAPRDNTQHIHLCDWADVFLIAPISMNTISKISHGVCDNLLASIASAYLGTKKPFIIAPAMNNNMWDNPINQKNIQTLKDEGIEIIEPETGFLACGSEGRGRLRNIDDIYRYALRAFYNKNPRKKITVTLGGTREKIDSVRSITNSSSGKMGIALCDWAFYLGYEVEAISTVEFKRPYKITLVESASQMLEELRHNDFDYLFMAAAVGDFRAKNIRDKKIQKEDTKDELVLEFVKNPDVVSEVAKNKKENQTIIGFCLSDCDLVEIAKKKLSSKNLDFIVANDISAIKCEKNEVTIIEKNGKIIHINSDTKENIAKKILEVVL